MTESERLFRRERFLKMAKAGASPAAIAERLGMTKAKVAKLAQSMGVALDKDYMAELGGPV